jgi:hypothetical protein
LWTGPAGFTPVNTSSPEITGLSIGGGNYTLIITDALGCANSISSYLKEPNPIGDISTVDVLCGSNATNKYPKGSASVSNVTGGTPTYNYIWPNGNIGTSASNLAAGNYYLTIIDSDGCQNEIPFTINQPLDVDADVTVIDVEECFGDVTGAYGLSNAQVTGGTSPYEVYNHLGVLVNPYGQMFASFPAGFYEGEIIDVNNCEYTYEFSISEPDELTANVYCTNSSRTSKTLSSDVGGGVPQYTYYWNWYVGMTPYSAITSSITIPNTTNSASLIVTDANGCVVTWWDFISNLNCNTLRGTEFQDESMEDVVKIYPNPANDILYIDLSGQELESVIIYNDLSQEIISTNIIEGGIDLNMIKPGIYIIKILTNQGVETKQFIKE